MINHILGVRRSMNKLIAGQSVGFRTGGQLDGRREWDLRRSQNLSNMVKPTLRLLMFIHFPLFISRFPYTVPIISHHFPNFFPQFSNIFPIFSYISHVFSYTFQHFPNFFLHFPTCSLYFPTFSSISLVFMATSSILCQCRGHRPQRQLAGAGWPP